MPHSGKMGRGPPYWASIISKTDSVDRGMGGPALGSVGGSARPHASTKGVSLASGKHDIITVERTVLSHPSSQFIKR